MAYGLYKYGTFTSTDGTAYKLNIYQDGFTGTSSEVTLDSSPIVTEYDSSDDILSPIRTQTGYIRIVEQSDDKAEIGIKVTSPTSHMITLTANSVVKWCGFLTQSNYSGEYTNGFCVRSYPVCSPFEMLKGATVSRTGSSVSTFAQFLKEALDATGLSWGNVYVPEYISDSTYGYLLPLYVKAARNAFFSRKVYANGDITWTGISYADVISDFATMFGWTLYEQGANLYFVSRTDCKYICIPYSSLAQIEAGTIVSGTEVSKSLVSSLESKGSNNSFNYILGAKSVEIKAKTGVVGNMIAIESGDMNFEDTYFENFYVQTNIMALFAMSYKPNVGCTWKFYSYDNSKTEYGEESEWTAMNVSGRCTGKEAISMSNTISAGYAKYDAYDESDVSSGDKVDYSFSEGICIACDYKMFYEDPDDPEVYDTNMPTYEESLEMPIIECNTESAIYLANCAICINAGYKVIDHTVPAHIVAMLKVGSYYWNGSNFTTTKSYFQISLDSSGFKNTKKFNDKYYGATGCVIPVKTPIYGVVEFSIFPPLETLLTPYRYVFTNLSVSYVPLVNNEYTNQTDENTYFDYTDNDVDNEVSVELPFSTAVDNQYGYNVLLLGNSLLGKFSGATLEDKLLSHMKEIYSKTSLQIQEVTNMVSIKPFDNIRSTDTFIQSISTDWASATQTITTQKF